jgi:hypothetical protein
MNNDKAADNGASPQAGAALPKGSLGGALRAWWANVQGMGRDYALLAALELQRAGIGLALILAAGVVVAVLVVSAWTALVAGVIVWAVQSGAAGWPLALGVAALANLLLAGFMVLQIRARATNIFLGATLRQLRGEGKEA